MSTLDLFDLLSGAGNLGKIWSAYGQHEIQHAEWTRWTMYV